MLSASGIVFGLGLSGSGPASATTPADCAGNTVTPATTGTLEEKEVENHLNISNEIREANGIVCLDGHFDVDGQIYFNRNAKVYGIGKSSSITSRYGTVFQSDIDNGNFFDVEINNLSIINSLGTAVLGGNVRIVASTISGNRNIGGGGAIIGHGDVTISNSTFSANEATYGGAIYSTNGGVVTISNSTLSDNTADADGGAISSPSGGTVTISNSTLSNNSSNTHGGAIYSGFDGTVTISNSTVSDNSADSLGGAIYVFFGAVTTSNSTLSDNFAGSVGGAIYGYGSVLTATNSTFLNNSALHGGAMYSEYDAEGGTVEISNSTFVDNDAMGSGSEGGAIFAYDGEVFFSTFVNNTASTPPDEPGDTPGNSIHKAGSGELEIGANIFSGASTNFNPQLGKSFSGSSFTDIGGNVFTTSSEVETGIGGNVSTVFGKNILSIFGTSTPSLASYAPNSSGSKTLALVVGSPALNAVPNRAPFNTFTLDQRGATRSFPASAGAFEGLAPVAPTATPTPTPTTAPAALAQTGSQNPLWAAIAAGSMLLVGGVVTAIASRLRRQTR